VNLRRWYRDRPLLGMFPHPILLSPMATQRTGFVAESYSGLTLAMVQGQPSGKVRPNQKPCETLDLPSTLDGSQSRNEATLLAQIARAGLQQILSPPRPLTLAPTFI